MRSFPSRERNKKSFFPRRQDVTDSRMGRAGGPHASLSKVTHLQKKLEYPLEWKKHDGGGGGNVDTPVTEKQAGVLKSIVRAQVLFFTEL